MFLLPITICKIHLAAQCPAHWYMHSRGTAEAPPPKKLKPSKPGFGELLNAFGVAESSDEVFRK